MRSDEETVISELVVTGVEKQPGETMFEITLEADHSGIFSSEVTFVDGAKRTKLEGLEEKVKLNNLT